MLASQWLSEAIVRFQDRADMPDRMSFVKAWLQRIWDTSEGKREARTTRHPHRRFGIPQRGGWPMLLLLLLKKSHFPLGQAPLWGLLKGGVSDWCSHPLLVCAEIRS